MTRILVAAPSAVVRAGLESILRDHPTFEIVGTVAAGGRLETAVAATEPDVVLVDLERSGVSASGRPTFVAGADNPALVVLVDDPDEADLTGILRDGVAAVLSRDAPPESIVAAVEGAANGLVILDRDAVSSLLSLVPATNRVGMEEQVETLTPREIEVLSMLSEGTGNKAIARRLGISEHTVKFHVGSILGKLGASSRTEAVTIGVRRGLILV